MLAIASPALAEVEQCRFIQAKPEREACYKRQEAALAEKRKQAATREADAALLAGADEPGGRRAQGAAAQHLPGLLIISCPNCRRAFPRMKPAPRTPPPSGAAPNAS